MSSSTVQKPATIPVKFTVEVTAQVLAEFVSTRELAAHVSGNRDEIKRAVERACSCSCEEDAGWVDENHPASVVEVEAEVVA